MTDPATTYAEQVAAGDILASRLVRKSCERHLRDLERKDLAWIPDKAARIFEFFEGVLTLSGGEHEGKPFKLEPSQHFILGSIFGWHLPDGYRRFRMIYVEEAKGNAKSPTAAGIGVYMTAFDDHPRAEVYAAATDKAQANVVFNDAVAMVDRDERLSARFQRFGGDSRPYNLFDPQTGSFFRPIASETRGRGKSGIRPHCVILDEIHEHPTEAMFDWMRAGIAKGDRNALLFAITNSGNDRGSVCWREHHYSSQVLEGGIADDIRFAYITGLDPCEEHLAEGRRFPVADCENCDSWEDERVWPKANPMIDVSVKRESIREQVREAKGMPSKRNTVLRLCFNVWTEQAQVWLPVEDWLTLEDKTLTEESLIGRRCIGALDLAYSEDTCALGLLFPPASPGEPWKFLERYWIPEDSILERGHEHQVPYLEWQQEGLLIATPGEVTNYAYVRDEILELSQRYEIERLPMDPTHGVQLYTELLGEGLPVELFPQGPAKFAPAVNEAERKIRAHEIAHRAHPVTTWQFGNVTMKETRDGRRFPDKIRSRGKIDGIACFLMALAVATETLGDAGETDDWGGGYIE